MDSQSIYSSFARWIVAQKRKTRPSGLFVVGVNGTIGQGKTVFSREVVQALTRLLTLAEGQALTLSLDDYYLSHAERYRPEFLARGYNPPGIPNRGPAGTHDVVRLLHDLRTMEEGGTLQAPSFDKQADDRSPEPRVVEGRIGVFILEGWFVGARTDVDPDKLPPGLKRSVAQALPSYAPVFDRLDALWAFEPPASLEEILQQRLEQQETLNRETGRTGMTPDQIRRFIRYFYEDAWEQGVTSPTPPRDNATFWARTNLQHQILSITPALSPG